VGTLTANKTMTVWIHVLLPGWEPGVKSPFVMCRATAVLFSPGDDMVTVVMSGAIVCKKLGWVYIRRDPPLKTLPYWEALKYLYKPEWGP
jgi:hypothetical protein